MRKQLKNPFVSSGLRAALYLLGAIPVLVVALGVGSQVFPGHDATSSLIQLLVFAGVLFAAGGLWGRSAARQIGWPRPGRLALATGIAFCLVAMLAFLALAQLERLLVEEGRAGSVPIHVLFGILFTTAAFVVAGITAAVVGQVVGGWRFGARLALRAGLASAGAFLLSDVVQDLLGRRVGGPHAEETFTMISVAIIGNIVAAFAAGGVMGSMLAARGSAHAAEREPAPTAATATS